MMHRQMVSIDFLLYMSIICYIEAIFPTLMRWITFYLVFMIPYSTQAIGFSMINHYLYSQFTFWFERILKVFHHFWYHGQLHMTLFEIETNHIRFHLESIDGLLNWVFMRQFFFTIVVFQSNCDVHPLSFMFEISWQRIYLRYGKLYAHTFRGLYHDVLFLFFYDIYSCLFHLTF